MLHSLLKSSKIVIPVLKAFLLFVFFSKEQITREKLPAEMLKHSVDQVFQSNVHSYFISFFKKNLLLLRMILKHNPAR